MMGASWSGAALLCLSPLVGLSATASAPSPIDASEDSTRETYLEAIEASAYRPGAAFSDRTALVQTAIEHLKADPPRQDRAARILRALNDEGADATMLEVPAGETFLGCNDRVDRQCKPHERPGRTMHVDRFLVDRTEVTAAAYSRCVSAGACSHDGASLPYYNERTWPEWSWSCNLGKAGREKHPVNCIDWSQAEGYCRWLGKRLPTEAEWEKAARGTDGRKYAWGNQAYGPSIAGVANIADVVLRKNQPDWLFAEGYDDGHYATSPVGRFPLGASVYGAVDVMGNLWEWTNDWYEPERLRAVRGGSWDDPPDTSRASSRRAVIPSLRGGSVGFRCVR